MPRLVSLIALSAICVSVLSGCWDRVEIEERGFIVGVAIDLAANNETGTHSSGEEPSQTRGKHRFEVTEQFVNPGGLRGQNSQGGGTSPDNKAYFNVTSVGNTMMEITGSLASRINRSPYYEHLKVIVLSDQVIKAHGMADAMDFFIRFPEMRRAVKVLISLGKAKDVLNVQALSEKIPAVYIDLITRNNTKNPRMALPSRVGDIQENMLKKCSFTIQRVIAGKKDVKISGQAIIDELTNSFIGYLGESEVEGMNFLTGKIKGGLLEVKFRDNLVSVETKRLDQGIEVDASDPERIRFTVSVNVDGEIAESLESVNYISLQQITELEHAAEEEIRRMTSATIHKIRDKYGKDIIYFGLYLSRKHPELWEQIKNDWEHGKNLFKQCEIIVKPHVSIQSVGVIIEDERK